MTLKEILAGRWYVIKCKYRYEKPKQIEWADSIEWTDIYFKDVVNSETIITLSRCFDYNQYRIRIGKQKLKVNHYIAKDMFYEASQMHKEQEDEKERKAAEEAKVKYEQKKNAAYRQISDMLNKQK